MINVIRTGLVLVIASALLFIAESYAHALPYLLTALGVQYNVGDYGPVLIALVPYVVVFVVGVLANYKACIITPLLLSVGVLTALVPMLGVSQIPQISSLAQIYVPSAVVAIIGSFVLTNGFDMWRVREGRIGMFWRVAFALELVNVSSYLLFTLTGKFGPIPVGLPILLIAGLVAYLVLDSFSDRAEVAKAAFEQFREDAAKVPGLKATIEQQNEKLTGWVKAHKEVSGERDTMAAEKNKLAGRVQELDAANKRLEALLRKPADGPAPVAPLKVA